MRKLFPLALALVLTFPNTQWARCPPEQRGFDPAPLKEAAVLALGVAPVAEAATPRVETIAAGTRFETPCYVRQSEQPGPVVMIVGGVHGDEPAGAAAAEQIRHWPIRRGTLVVVPRANVPGLEAKRRLTPGVPKPLENLNRNFPKKGEPTPARGVPATDLWQLVQRYQPDWLLDLHEGFDFRQINRKSVGSSVIAPRTEALDGPAQLLLDAVNATIDEPRRKFVRLGPPVDGSLARAAAEHSGVRAMILETTQKAQPLSKRARQHRIMVHRLLEHLEMVEPSVTIDQVIDRENVPG